MADSHLALALRVGALSAWEWRIDTGEVTWSRPVDGLDPATLPLINTSMPPRPNGPYGIGKACSEATARYFCDYFGMAAICLRLGTMGRDDSGPRDQRHRA